MDKPENNLPGRFHTRELAIVLSHYDLGTIGEILRCGRGNEQSPKLIIVSDKGKFLLKRRVPSKSIRLKIAQAHHCLLYLHGAGFCVPRLVATNHNHSLVQDETHIYEMFEYLGGQDYDGAGSTAIGVGRCLRQFHDLLSRYQPPEPLPKHCYHDNDSVRERLRDYSDSEHEYDADEAGRLSEILLEAYDGATRQAEEMGLPESPQGICHGDWHPGNLLFQGHEIVAVLDFESLGIMPLWAEVANGCLQFSLVAQGRDPENWPAELDIFRAGCFLRGYRTEKLWANSELQVIVALMIEALIAEAIAPIAATGKFTNIQGSRFLRMISRKVEWLNQFAADQLTLCQQGDCDCGSNE